MRTKKITNTIQTICLSLTILFSFSGCEDWLDVNTSKDMPVEGTIDQLLPVVVFYASQITYDHAEYGVYLSQALTTGGKSQTGSYGYKGGWEFLTMNRHPQWRRHFYDIGVNVNALMTLAEEQDAKNVQLIARTIKLYSTLLTTDAFGDMPHSQVYKSNTPPYDTQESIYEWMYREADELIRLYSDDSWVNHPANRNISVKMDRIFSGDMAKWGVFAKAIKARLLLRKLPNWDNTPAVCDEIIRAADAALDDPAYVDVIYKYDGGSAEQNCPWGPAQPKLNIGWAQARDNLLTDAVPSKFFLYGMLGAYSRESAYRYERGYALDPRAVKWMKPVSGFPMYYLENNIGMLASEKIADYPNLYADGQNPITKNDGYIFLISKEELLFIKAEAQYWKKEKTLAYNTYLQAVETNLNRLDAIPAEGTSQTAYERFRSIKFRGESDFSIADLMQQKYIAMYLQPEQWTDVRRYNYSSKTNGIQYGFNANEMTYVYTITTCYKPLSATSNPANPTAVHFQGEFSLTRPFNLYAPYWDITDCYGQNAKFSPNAWICRLNYDPETEDKYNRKELERLGAYKNPEWLKKRMIWAYKKNDSPYITCSDETEWK
jgi:hypothetical protein